MAINRLTTSMVPPRQSADSPWLPWERPGDEFIPRPRVEDMVYAPHRPEDWGRNGPNGMASNDPVPVGAAPTRLVPMAGGNSLVLAAAPAEGLSGYDDGPVGRQPTDTGSGSSSQLRAPVAARTPVTISPEFETIIQQAAREYNVDPRLIRAVMIQESGGRPDAVSPAGARGLMQLMPATARSLGVQDAHDPTQAIPAATRHISDLLRMSNGNVEEALRLYHAGPNRARWGARTNAYPGLVLRHFETGQPAPAEAPSPPPAATVPGAPLSQGGSPFTQGVQLAQSGGALPLGGMPSGPPPPLREPLNMPITPIPPDLMDWMSGVERPNTPRPGATGRTAAPAGTTPGLEDFLQGGQPGPTRPLATPERPAGYNPSMRGRVGEGLFRGVRDVVDAPAQWLAGGAEAIGLTGAIRNSRLGRFLNDNVVPIPTGAEARAGNVADRQAFDSTYGDSGAALMGRIGGNIAGTVGPIRAGSAVLGGLGRIAGAAAPAAAPVLNALTGATVPANTAARLGTAGLRGATEGVAASALTLDPNRDTGEQLATGAAIGGALGGIVMPAVAGVRNALSPRVDPNVTDLAERVGNLGVRIRGSQMTNPRGLTRRMDTLLEDTPLSGQPARNEEQARSWYRALGRQMGANTDHIDAQVVRGALRDAGQRIERASAGVALPSTDATFNASLNRIISDAELTLGADRAGVIRRQAEHIREVLANGTGDGYRTLTTHGSPLSRLARSRDTDVGQFARDARAALDDLLERSVPADRVEALREARRHYYVASQLRPLADASPDGAFNPAQLLARVGGTNVPELKTLADAGRQFLGHFTGSPTEARQWARRMLNLGPVALETGLLFHDPRMAAVGALGLGATAATGNAVGRYFNSDAMRNRLIDAGRAARYGGTPAPGVFSRGASRAAIPGAVSAERTDWGVELPPVEYDMTVTPNGSSPLTPRTAR